MDSDSTLCSLLALALKENIVQLILALSQKGREYKKLHVHPCTHTHIHAHVCKHTCTCSEVSVLKFLTFYPSFPLITDCFHGDILS